MPQTANDAQTRGRTTGSLADVAGDADLDEIGGPFLALDFQDLDGDTVRGIGREQVDHGLARGMGAVEGFEDLESLAKAHDDDSGSRKRWQDPRGFNACASGSTNCRN